MHVRAILYFQKRVHRTCNEYLRFSNHNESRNEHQLGIILKKKNVNSDHEVDEISLLNDTMLVACAVYRCATVSQLIRRFNTLTKLRTKTLWSCLRLVVIYPRTLSSLFQGGKLKLFQHRRDEDNFYGSVNPLVSLPLFYRLIFGIEESGIVATPRRRRPSNPYSTAVE